MFSRTLAIVLYLAIPDIAGAGGPVERLAPLPVLSGTVYIKADCYARALGFTSTTAYIADARAHFTPADQLFADTVAAHFLNAKTCWKQRGVPSQKVIDRITIGCIEEGKRRWPSKSEMPYRMFTLILTETGGRNEGNPDDPSYGVCCASIEVSHIACQTLGIRHPKSKMCDARCRGLMIRCEATFKEWLETDVLFNIACGAGELKMCENEEAAHGDFVRALGIYKCGVSGFRKALRNLGDKPVTELRIWKKYVQIYEWLTCLNVRIQTQTVIDCGCLAPDPPLK
jgi:hypothetical protein